jgi:hypothetical protein
VSRLIAIATLLLVAAACGSSGTATAPSPSPSGAATPSASSAPALVFKLNGVGGAKAAGTISVTTQSGSMTIELKITGLQANSSHVSHIHIGKCAARGGIKFALNQVVADGQGDADIKTTLKAIYPPTTGTWYVVVHAGPDMQGTNSTYLLCGNIFK